MSEPHDHSPSGFEAPPGDDPESGASRFWHQYGSARPHGRPGTRNGGVEAGPGPEGDRGDVHGRECLEWCPICRGAEVVRATTPPELREQWQTVQRDALEMLRALIDAYLERIGDGPGRRGARSVEDIPIE